MSSKIMALIEELINPPEEFTPIPFWFLNDEPDKAEILRQLTDFREKGVTGVVVHPRIGIPKELVYMSKDYLEVIRYIVETASKLEMLIVLYDEGMYPSGSAHGQVVRGNPEYGSIGITLTNQNLDGKSIVEFDDGYRIVQRHCGGTIRGIHFGEDDGEPNAPASADILNPKAVDKFINLTHQRYYDVLKEYFGNTIIGIFTDEPCVLGRNVAGYMEWTEGLEKAITERGGKPEELRALFEKEENETTDIYHTLVRERLNNVYYGKLSKWCEEHGIALMGHPQESDDIEEQKYFHVPGQDLVFRRVSPETGGIECLDSVQAKCSADAARHMNRRRNSNECFGVCGKDNNPWYITGADMKWFIDWLGVRGVNMFIPHAFYYSFEGERKNERPPDVGPRNIWWKHYKYFSDYMKRVSYVMTDSKSMAEIIVPCTSGKMPYSPLKAFYEGQVEFHYGDYAMVANADVKDGALAIGENRYRYYLSEKDMGLPIKRITSLQELEGWGDFVTDKPCKNLRAAHVVKNGADIYFLTNEGTEHLSVSASVPVKGKGYLFDLWYGRLYPAKVSQLDNGEGFESQVNLELEAYESVLLIFSEEAEEIDGYVTSGEREIITISADTLQQVSHNPDKIQKTYKSVYTADTIKETIQVIGEEMVECYCNKEFAGVSFWNPHRFDIGGFIKEGENELELVVTGNIANKYSGKAVDYGLI